jgi:predicted transcriptional regulator
MRRNPSSRRIDMRKEKGTVQGRGGMIDRVRGEVELLGRHMDVLKTVYEHQPIGIMKLAELMDLPYHRIRYSLRVLERMGYIRASPAGAVITPRTEVLYSTLESDLGNLQALLGSIQDKIPQMFNKPRK